MNNKSLYCMILLVLAGLFSNAQEIDKFKQQLEAINIEIEQSFMEENVHAFSKFYTTESVIMPEYHKTLYGAENINHYFQQWFNMVNTNSYKRTVYETQFINNNYLLETGTYNNSFVKENADPFIYEENI